MFLSYKLKNLDRPESALRWWIRTSAANIYFKCVINASNDYILCHFSSSSKLTRAAAHKMRSLKLDPHSVTLEFPNVLPRPKKSQILLVRCKDLQQFLIVWWNMLQSKKRLRYLKTEKEVKWVLPVWWKCWHYCTEKAAFKCRARLLSTEDS